MNEEIIVKIGADISGLASDLKRAQADIAGLGDKVEGIEGSGTKAAFGIGKIVTAIGLVAIAAGAFKLVKDSIGQAFGRIDTMEQFERVMTTMTGSSEKANEVLDRTNEIVKGTAYGLDVGAKAVQNFVTSNMDVDKATDTVAAWGDAVAFYGDGSNESFASVSDALSKMTAKGKVQMDTMNRLTEAGIPAMQIYADATGQSVEAVADQMSKGELDAGKFTDVMNDALTNGTKNFEGIEGAAREAGTSWDGSFANMRAAVARGTTAIIENIDAMLADNGLPSMRDMIADFGSKFEDVMKSIANAIPPAVEAFKTVYDVIKPLMPVLKPLALAVVTFVAAVATVNSVISVFNLVTTAVKLLNAAFWANPVALIIGAIIAAAVLIYVYWEPISKFFVALWEVIKNAGLAIWDSLKDAWAVTVEFIKSIWASVADFFSGLWTSISSTAISVWDSVVEKWNSIVALFTDIFSPAIDFYSNLWTTITESAVEIFSIFTETLSAVWSNIQTIAAAAWEIIKNVILGPILLLINLVTGDFNEFASNLSKIQENIRAAAGRIWEALKSNVTLIITALVSIGSKLWNNFKDTLKNIISAIKQVASNLWEQLKTSVIRIITGLVSSAVGKWNELKTRAIEIVANIVSDLIGKWEDLKTKTLDKIKSVKDNVINPLKEINLLQIGKDIIDGLIKGIVSKVTAVGNAVKEVTSAITGKIKGILGIASPSRVLAQIGRWTGEGLAQGIAGEEANVARAAQGLADASVVEPTMSYATPNANYGSLSAALSGEVNVNQRDSMLVGAIASLEDKLTNLRVEMDGQKVGSIVRPHVNSGNAVDDGTRYF